MLHNSIQPIVAVDQSEAVSLAQTVVEKPSLAQHLCMVCANPNSTGYIHVEGHCKSSMTARGLRESWYFTTVSCGQVL